MLLLRSVFSLLLRSVFVVVWSLLRSVFGFRLVVVVVVVVIVVIVVVHVGQFALPHGVVPLCPPGVVSIVPPCSFPITT